MKRLGKKDLIEVALAYGLMLLLLIIGASSCKSYKSSSSHIFSKSGLTKISKTDLDAGLTSNSFVLEWDTASLNRLWTATIFDTNVCDSSGNHPVKAIIEGKDEISSRSVKTSQTQDSAKIVIQSNDSIVAKNEMEITEDKESSLESTISKDAACITLLIVAIAMTYLIFKIFK